uniref:Uncharacterized protein n=1 Tax=Heliothis virescens TaxID=7102 RepID=A0A2A4JK33_HELVI
MSDPGEGPSSFQPHMFGFNGAAGSGAPRRPGTPPRRASTANIGQLPKSQLPRIGRIGKMQNRNSKIRAIKNKLDAYRAKCQETVKEMRKLRLAETIEIKIKRIKHRTSLLERDIDILNTLLNKDSKIGKDYASRLDRAKELNDIKNRIECIKQKEPQKETEIRSEIDKMLRIESETKATVDRNIEVMEIYRLNKKREISAAIEEMKNKEAIIQIEMENDIENLQEKLIEAKREFDTNIKAMQKYEREKKNELQSKIEKNKQNHADLKRDTETKINNMKISLATNEKNFDAYRTDMQKYEAVKIGEINNKIIQIECNEAKLRSETENKIKNMQNELAMKEKKSYTNIKTLLRNEIEKMREIKDKIKQIDSKEAKLKDDIENKIQHAQKELATKEKEYEIFTKAMRKYEAKKISEIKHKIRQIECDKIQVDMENNTKHMHNEPAANEKQSNIKTTRRRRTEQIREHDYKLIEAQLEVDIENNIKNMKTERRNELGTNIKAMQNNQTAVEQNYHSRTHDDRWTPYKYRTPDKNCSGRSTPRDELQQRSSNNFFVRAKEEVMDDDEETMNISIAWDDRREHRSTPTPRYYNSFQARVKAEPDDETMDISINKSSARSLSPFSFFK